LFQEIVVGNPFIKTESKEGFMFVEYLMLLHEKCLYTTKKTASKETVLCF